MPAEANHPLQIGEWLVDPRDDSLTRGPDKLKIEPRTMRLLVRLAQAPGEVVSVEELLESVWSGVIVGSASVYQSMSQLRKMLGDTDNPPRYVETVARKGYRLIAPVSVPAASGTQRALRLADLPALPSDSPVAPASSGQGKGRRRWIALSIASALAVMMAVWQFAPRIAPTPEAVSIVVLPFVDLTTGKTEQAFCDGLTEETSNWLAQIPTLHVVAQTSAFSYRDRVPDVRTIGRELQTNHVLKGALRRSGNQMRITVQLIDTRTGYQLWSGSYDVEAGDVLKVQETLARAVASNLELRMTADTDTRFAGRTSRNAEAQRLYLIAKSHAAKLDPAENEQAIMLYRQALEADPTFALAKIWLAHAISNRMYFNRQLSEELAPEIESLLAAAAKTAPQLVDLYVVRGGFHLDLRQREPAMRDLQRAIEMDPNSTSALRALGYYYLTAGEPRDALTYYTMASGLDPRNFGPHTYRCIALTDLAQFGAAESACDRARALEPDTPWVYSVSSSMEAARGHLAEAIKWSDVALERSGDVSEMHAERARWLLGLGLIGDAGAVYRRAVAVNAGTAHQNPGLTFIGSLAAIDSAGAAGLRAFIRENDLGQTSNPAQLFVLADAAVIARDFKLAKEYLDRALASRTLQPEDLASPWQARVGESYLIIAAVVQRDNGDAVGAQRRLDELGALLERLVNAGLQTAGFHELRAQLAAMRGQGDAAMEALQRAVQLGWSDVWLAEHQPYFDSLRKRADFRLLLEAARKRNAATAVTLASRLSDTTTRTTASSSKK